MSVLLLTGLKNRMSEIEHYMEDGTIESVDYLNEGIDRVSLKLEEVIIHLAQLHRHTHCALLHLPQLPPQLPLCSRFSLLS